MKIGDRVKCRIDSSIRGDVVGFEDGGFIVVVRGGAGALYHLPAADVVPA